MTHIPLDASINSHLQQQVSKDAEIWINKVDFVSVVVTFKPVLDIGSVQCLQGAVQIYTNVRPEHSVLRLEELSLLDVKHALLHCKAVRVDNTLSSWKHTHGGVPQGTILGLTLFSIVIYRIWNLRGEMCGWHNKASIYHWELSLDYCLWSAFSPKKYREIVINFMPNPKYATRAKYINWCTRSWESFRGYTLQGVIITANFWNDQVDYISMASKRLRDWRKFPLSHDQWDSIIAWWGL